MVQDLYKEDLTLAEKNEIAFEMLIVNHETAKKLTVEQLEELIKDIFTDHINGKQKRKPKNDTKVFDFNEDAEYLYSSFMYDYKIDLVDMQGKLHWKKFIALFQGLGATTKIKEVINIRSRELPKMNKSGSNAKEIQELRELKAYYSLGEIEENFQDGLEKLFSTLEKMAVNEE